MNFEENLSYTYGIYGCIFLQLMDMKVSGKKPR